MGESRDINLTMLCLILSLDSIQSTCDFRILEVRDRQAVA